MAVVEHGSLTYAKAFGSADVASGRGADTETRYAVGSVSKQFTAAALLLLQEQAKLSLMPAGLQMTMTTQEFVDLIEFLASLKKPPN